MVLGGWGLGGLINGGVVSEGKRREKERRSPGKAGLRLQSIPETEGGLLVVVGAEVLVTLFLLLAQFLEDLLGVIELVGFEVGFNLVEGFAEAIKLFLVFGQVSGLVSCGHVLGLGGL